LDNCYNDYIYKFALYHHIQYNSINYYSAEDQYSHFLGALESVTVYLVDRRNNVLDNYPYEAKTFEEDPENIYLFFDSAIWSRDKSLAAKRYGF